jgi:Mce-associated membrane protein
MGMLKRRSRRQEADGGADLDATSAIAESDDVAAQDIDADGNAAVEDIEMPLDAPPPGATRRAVGFAALLLLAAGSAGAAAFFKYQAGTAHAAEQSGTEAVQAASDGTIAMLSYHADSVAKDLSTAANRLAGGFRADYEKLAREVVIPGSQQKRISSVASVPSAATMSATPGHAVVLVFVDQNITVGSDAPTSSSSSVRVTMDKVGDRWLISGFDPV